VDTESRASGPAHPGLYIRVVQDPLLENLRAFAASVAEVLGGTALQRAGLVGFVSSEFDPFLNQLFASGRVVHRDITDELQGRPAFVWLAEQPTDSADVIVMQGMVADIADPAPAGPAVQGEIGEVRSDADLDAWHDVYREVFGADPRSRDDWRRVHRELGPTGARSLVLLLARVDGSPAATGAVFVAQGIAGLYCFTTRESMRRRGLASALVHAAHETALAIGVQRALLQATPAGRPVYARASYREERALPVLRVRGN
jgi:GNAT superfamily N-acetyltransferase